MSSMNELKKSNLWIILGVIWFIIALIFITDKSFDNHKIRIVDWIGWIAMFTTGTFSIINGLRLKKDNHKKLF